jgi:hypothetical protein
VQSGKAEQNMAKTLEIFISSAKEDKKFLDMLLKALEGSLKPLKQQGFVSLWHERDIRPGAAIKQEIQKHLETARIILLLISADFMSLPFCDSEEMQLLMRRHEAGELHIIPILLRETYWETAPFGALQPLPDNGEAVSSWGNRDKAFLNIAKGVRKIVDGLISPTPTHGGEAEEIQSKTKGLSDSSSQHPNRKPSSSFTDGQRSAAKASASPMLAQVYDGVVNYWGVVVGVGEYEDTNNYSPMSACVADAKAVAKQLTYCGYDRNHMRLLVDRDTDEDPLIQELTGNYAGSSKPTKGNIIDALTTVAQMTDPEDLLLFYYSGHGSMEGQESYLVAHDGHKNALEYTALSVSTMKKIMLRAPAQKKVIILDACRAETAPGSKGMPQSMSPAFIERVFEQAKGLVILTSCGAGENSYVWEEKKCSVFTYYLLKALQSRNADFNGKDRISADDIHKYVLDKVRRWAMVNNRLQNPRITIDDGQGDIIVAYYQQEFSIPGAMVPGNHAMLISPSPMGALSWRDIQAITIQGEKYIFDRATERPISDDGATLREARARHVETDLLLCLKQAHIVGLTADGIKLQKILKREREILIDLENEGHRDFPRVFPLIDGDAEKDFMFAYILKSEKSLFQTFGGSKGPRNKASIKCLLQSVLPLCEALSVLHKKNLSHRCLSPNTLVLFKERYIMVQDIGLAARKPIEGENPDRYSLAPEQDEKSSDVKDDPGPATDIYQLGTLLYRLITGRTFSPGSLPSFYNQAVSPQLNETIRRAVARQPMDRWPDIEAFSAALRQCM